jgi:hypothetical protein
MMQEGDRRTLKIKGVVLQGEVTWYRHEGGRGGQWVEISYKEAARLMKEWEAGR